ncbi:MAG TPA: hypothetical protein DCL44_07085 [Elusimicrobia bacterium]|nr:hypothetical protein [Elusimicrobiota bacterium]
MLQILNIVRHARVEVKPKEAGRLVSPRAVSVALPDRFETPAFVSLAKDYVPDTVYAASNGNTQAYSPERNIIKRYNPKRRLAPF